MLVNTRTQNLPPDEQHQGTYRYTPIEVQMYDNGESLTVEEQRIVSQFYGCSMWSDVPPPRNIKTKLTVPPELKSAIAVETIGVDPLAILTGYGEQSDQTGLRKVIRKSDSKPRPAQPMLNIIQLALPSLLTHQKESLFNQLAEELGYTVE